jgi:hypothetical protein
MEKNVYISNNGLLCDLDDCRLYSMENDLYMLDNDQLMDREIVVWRNVYNVYMTDICHVMCRLTVVFIQWRMVYICRITIILCIVGLSSLVFTLWRNVYICRIIVSLCVVF